MPVFLAVILWASSTHNGQTPENQLRELRAVAKRHGWEIVATYTDKGISGAKGRDQRHEELQVRIAEYLTGRGSGEWPPKPNSE